MAAAAGDESAATGECLNCGAPLSDQFCAGCGQARIDLHASTWRHAKESVAEVFDVDARLPRTARAMLSPGLLTTEYLRGRRAPYLSPVKLFLLAGTILTTTWISTRGIDAHFYGMAADRSAARFIDSAVRGLLASVVALAILSWLMRGARRRFLDDLVFSAHLVSALSLWVSVIVWIGTGWKLVWGTVQTVPEWLPPLPYLLFLPAAVLDIVYLTLAVRRAQGGAWWATLLRSLAFGALGAYVTIEVIVRGG